MAQVFVVDRAAFFGGKWAQGFVPMAGASGAAFLERAFTAGRFVERAEAESTPAWKQWIPYCVLRCVGENPHKPCLEGILHVQRSKGQSETRLHGRWSIGLGGHVEPEDSIPEDRPAGSGARFFSRSLARELTEELCLPATLAGSPRFLGLLNDDSTAVGSVHAGLVYQLDLPLSLELANKTVRIREISKMCGGFGSLVELRKLWQDPLQLETWSQLLVEAGLADPMGLSANHPTAAIRNEP